MTEITYDQEMNFAREFYSKAVEGLEPKEYPPTPDDWVENSDILCKQWELTKVELIGLLEQEETSKEIREDTEAFLKCTLALYLDLMCSICKTFRTEKTVKIEDVKRELSKSLP